MVAPFVLPAIPIATAIGRFAAPYLVKELGKMGANKFAKTYGNEAFTSLNETLANNTLACYELKWKPKDMLKDYIYDMTRKYDPELEPWMK